MPRTKIRIPRHHSVARRIGSAVLSFLALALFVAPSAWARPPSKKQIDEALLGLPDDALGAVQEVRASLSEVDARQDEAERSLDIARKDHQAAKSWVDASNAVVRAVATERKASEAADRSAEITALSAKSVRAESSLQWRKSRFTAAKARIVYLQAKIAWIKAERSRHEAGLRKAKLSTYEASVESTPDIASEIGRAEASVAKAEEKSGATRAKLEKSEKDWQSAVATASAMAP